MSLLPKQRDSFYWRAIRPRHDSWRMEFGRDHTRCSNGYRSHQQQFTIPEKLPFGTSNKGLQGLSEVFRENPFEHYISTMTYNDKLLLFLVDAFFFFTHNHFYVT